MGGVHRPPESAMFGCSLELGACLTHVRGVALNVFRLGHVFGAVSGGCFCVAVLCFYVIAAVPARLMRIRSSACDVRCAGLVAAGELQFVHG